MISKGMDPREMIAAKEAEASKQVPVTVLTKGFFDLGPINSVTVKAPVTIDVEAVTETEQP